MPDYAAALAYLEAENQDRPRALAEAFGHSLEDWGGCDPLRELVFSAAVLRLADADPKDTRDRLPRVRDACAAFGCREDADREARKILARLRRWEPVTDCNSAA